MKISPEEACTALLDGSVVAVPTETVYGLAASFTKVEAIKQIFSIKNRPHDNPLIVHIGQKEDLKLLTESINETHEKLMQAFWPGPLTLLFDAHEKVSTHVTAGQKTVAVRMPRHPMFLYILQKTGPLVAPSANISGRPSPTCAEHVEYDFGIDFPIVDGGACSLGLESTIVSVSTTGSCTLLREGALSQQEIAAHVPLESNKSSSVVPGSKYKHYAPLTPLAPLETTPVHAVIGFTDRSYEAQHVFHLGASTNPHEIGKRLYALLRAIDQCKLERVHIDLNFPREGLYATIWERLLRAMNLSSDKIKYLICNNNESKKS